MSPTWLARIEATLHATDAPPAGEAWNAGELVDLLPPGQGRTPAAVLVPLRPAGAELQVLMTRRTESLRHHAGQVSFPGGRLEPADAGPLAAALRESHEEVGLAPAQVRPLGFLDPFETITGYHVWPVVAEVLPGFVARPDPTEVAEVFEAIRGRAERAFDGALAEMPPGFPEWLVAAVRQGFEQRVMRLMRAAEQ